MQRRTLFASLGLALAGLTTAWALDGKSRIIGDANAVERSYVRGFFAGDPSIWDSNSAGFETSMIGFVADDIARKLDLDQAQKGKLNDLVKAATAAFHDTKSDSAFDMARIHALPLPEQLSAIRVMAQKTDTVLADLQAPLTDFHVSLDASQQQKLANLMAEHRGTGHRGGWWHRRG